MEIEGNEEENGISASGIDLSFDQSNNTEIDHGSNFVKRGSKAR